jgi:hypothetical protein
VIFNPLFKLRKVLIKDAALFTKSAGTVLAESSISKSTPSKPQNPKTPKPHLRNYKINNCGKCKVRSVVTRKCKNSFQVSLKILKVPWIVEKNLPSVCGRKSVRMS